MKHRHLFRWIALGLVAAVLGGVLYCNLATWFYIPPSFAVRAWVIQVITPTGSALEHEQEFIRRNGWQSIKVEMKTLHLDTEQPYGSGFVRWWRRVNYDLLILNGYRAVHVDIPNGGGVLGSIGIYHNPFTGVEIYRDIRL